MTGARAQLCPPAGATAASISSFHDRLSPLPVVQPAKCLALGAGIGGGADTWHLSSFHQVRAAKSNTRDRATLNLPVHQRHDYGGHRLPAPAPMADTFRPAGIESRYHPLGVIWCRRGGQVGCPDARSRKSYRHHGSAQETWPGVNRFRVRK